MIKAVKDLAELLKQRDDIANANVFIKSKNSDKRIDQVALELERMYQS